MKSIFEFRDYRAFVRRSFDQRAKNGFGEATKLAKALNVNSTLISQVLGGTKSFSAEQALTTALYLNLKALETEYFLMLIHLDRAGTKEYRAYLEKQLKDLKSKSEQLVNRVRHESKISEEHRARYYSDWAVLAIHLATLLPKLKTVEALAERFHLPDEKIRTITDFLIEAGLLKLNKGEFSYQRQSTHLEGTSPWIKAHHSNWRQKAIEDVSFSLPSSLHYSAPLTISKKDAEKIREILIQTINSVDEILGPSESEELFCLNIDWFRVR